MKLGRSLSKALKAWLGFFLDSKTWEERNKLKGLLSKKEPDLKIWKILSLSVFQKTRKCVPEGTPKVCLDKHSIKRLWSDSWSNQPPLQKCCQLGLKGTEMVWNAGRLSDFWDLVIGPRWQKMESKRIILQPCNLMEFALLGFRLFWDPFLLSDFSFGMWISVLCLSHHSIWKQITCHSWRVIWTQSESYLKCHPYLT